MAIHAGQKLDGFSYKVSQQSRWKVPTYKQETAFTFKLSLQLCVALVPNSFKCQVSKLST